MHFQKFNNYKYFNNKKYDGLKGIIKDCEDISLELGFHFTYLFCVSILSFTYVFIHVQCQLYFLYIKLITYHFWSLISYQVFSKLFRHYRRKL